MPSIFRFIIAWISPLFITVLAAWYAVTAMIPELLMQNIPAEQVGGRWLGRLTLLAMLIVILLMIRAAWKRNGGNEHNLEVGR